MKTFLLLSVILLGSLTLNHSEALLLGNSQSTSSVSGIVHDQYGQVRVDVLLEVRENEKLLAQTRSDEKGQFRFADLPSKELVIRATRLRDWVTFCFPVKVSLKPGETKIINLELDLRPDSSAFKTAVKGDVLGTDTSPLNAPPGNKNPGLSDAFIRVYDPFTQELIVEAASDKNGEFSLVIPRTGQFVIQVFKPGYKVGVSTIVATGGYRKVSFDLAEIRILDEEKK
jgi:hypothetical protein